MTTLGKMIKEEKLRRRRVSVLERKIVGMKRLFRCIKNDLLPDGLFLNSNCEICTDKVLCLKIQKLVEEDIKKTYDSVR